MTDQADRPIHAQQAALRRGDTSAAELTETALARIEARDPALNAFVHIDAENAKIAAGMIDARLALGEDPGALAGIPVALKDMIDAQAMPGRCGSYAFDPTPPEHDAALVARLRQAGAVIIGKVATYEFALNGPAWDQPYPPARNPWGRNRITGGSSSGSAAAVAGGLVRASVGTDTGGSIRSPASYCGVVGLKPTRAAVPMQGVFPLAPSLDVAGPLAACVSDAAIVLDAMSGGTASSHLGQDIGGMRVAYARNWIAKDPATDAAVLSALDDAASLLSLLGVAIELAELPDAKLVEAVGSTILAAEAWSVHRERLDARSDDYGRNSRKVLLAGAEIGEGDARASSMRFAAEVDAALEGCDAIITATTLQTAPDVECFREGPVWTPMRTLLFNMTGHPAISLPCGFADGLPIGLQIIARHGDEARLCQLADAFEQATAHSLIRPLIA